MAVVFETFLDGHFEVERNSVGHGHGHCSIPRKTKITFWKFVKFTTGNFDLFGVTGITLHPYFLDGIGFL